jgi:hypothetical protein
MAEFDRIGRDRFLAKYGYRRARRYLIDAGGKRYDSKAIAGVAYGIAFPERGPLKFDDFRGGEAVVKRKLESLGFHIVEVDGDALAELRSDAPPIAEIAAEIDARASRYGIGQLQTMRAELHGKRSIGPKILSRLTGFSVPVFGVSWSPPEAERAVARRVIASLEDRRVSMRWTPWKFPSIASVRSWRSGVL